VEDLQRMSIKKSWLLARKAATYDRINIERVKNVETYGARVPQVRRQFQQQKVSCQLSNAIHGFLLRHF
jgi:hypothetical protein